MKKKSYIVSCALILLVLLLLGAFANWAILSDDPAPVKNGTALLCALSNTDIESEQNEDTGGENIDIFTRFREWFDQNTEEMISLIGLIVTLVILPLLRNLGNKSDKVSGYIGDVGNKLAAAVDKVNEGSAKMLSSESAIAEILRSNGQLNEELEKVRAELLVSKEQLNALLNCVYTAFMGSNVSDGVKNVLSDYMHQAMSYRGENQIAKEKLDKTRELLADVVESVDDASGVLGGKKPIDR